MRVVLFCEVPIRRVGWVQLGVVERSPVVEKLLRGRVLHPPRVRLANVRVVLIVVMKLRWVC